MNKTKYLTSGAMATALSILFLLICTFIPTGKLAMGFIASFIPCILLIETLSHKTALISGVASSLIALFLLPKGGLSGVIVIFYCLCFSYYPVLKSKIEQQEKLYIEWLIKIIYFIILSFAIKFLAEMYGITVINVLICTIVFIAYDMLLTYVISYYIKTIHPRIKKSRKG